MPLVRLPASLAVVAAVFHNASLRRVLAGMPIAVGSAEEHVDASA